MASAAEVAKRLSLSEDTGSAAVVIINVFDDDKVPLELEYGNFGSGFPKPLNFLVQRKTEGYPFTTMVGSLCLFGGNREEGDRCCIGTLKRELKEELGDETSAELLSRTRFFGRYLIEAPSSALRPSALRSYAFVTCVFHSWLPRSLLPSVCKEGSAVIFDAHEESAPETFAWAYDTPLSDFILISQKESCAQLQISAGDISCGCTALRIANSAKIDDWSDQCGEDPEV